MTAFPSQLPGVGVIDTSFIRIGVVLSEALVGQLDAEAKAAQCPVDKVIADRLERFAHLAPAERHLILNQVDLLELDEALGGRPVAGAQDLLTRVKRAGSVSLASVRLELTTPQKERLKQRAGKNGRTYEQEVRIVVTQLVAQLIDTTG